LIYIFLGPPGSGKGTQAKKLAVKLNVPHVAVGDMLREAVNKESEIGKQVKSFMEEGKLVPDEVTIKLTEERLKKDDCKNGLILDGFPRSAKQALALDLILDGKNFKVIYFYVSLEAVVERNSGRLSCKCGAVFHIKYNPSKREDICDKCGEKLYQRNDDNPEVIRNRYKVYEESTRPLIEFYEKKNRLVKIEAEGSIDDVYKRLLEVIDK